MAIACGADALGFNLFSGSPRCIDLDENAGWIGTVSVRTKVAVLVNRRFPTPAVLRNTAIDPCNAVTKSRAWAALQKRLAIHRVASKPRRLHHAAKYCTHTFRDALVPGTHGGAAAARSLTRRGYRASRTEPEHHLAGGLNHRTGEAVCGASICGGCCQRSNSRRMQRRDAGCRIMRGYRSPGGSLHPDVKSETQATRGSFAETIGNVRRRHRAEPDAQPNANPFLMVKTFSTLCVPVFAAAASRTCPSAPRSTRAANPTRAPQSTNKPPGQLPASAAPGRRRSRPAPRQTAFLACLQPSRDSMNFKVRSARLRTLARQADERSDHDKVAAPAS